jgi:hypothetical protein
MRPGYAARYSRHARGLKLMEATRGVQAAARIRESFAGVCPDCADYLVEAGFADVYGRGGGIWPNDSF